MRMPRIHASVSLSVLSSVNGFDSLVDDLIIYIAIAWYRPSPASVIILMCRDARDYIQLLRTETLTIRFNQGDRTRALSSLAGQPKYGWLARLGSIPMQAGAWIYMFSGLRENKGSIHPLDSHP